MRSFILIFLLFLFCSCAKTAPEKVDEAIDLALSYLTNEQCDKAIDVLEDAGRDTENAIYLQVLASAYACRASYNEITFLTTDIPAINSTAVGLMKSLSLLTLSGETATNSAEYVDLRQAFTILTNVDAAQPSYVTRVASYGARKASDMGVQTLFLGLVQLGKFIHYYGNVNATTGVKGGGTQSNNCFLEYTDPRAIVALGALGATCNDMSTDDGHVDLSFAAGSLTATKKKMCEGLVLVTNIIDILENITLPASSSYGSITTLPATISTFKTSIIAADATLSTLLNTTSQSTCETLVTAAAEFNNLQYIYALLFEVGLP